MRHHRANRIFGRSKNQRTALVKGLAASLVARERIMTTEAKAKELRPTIEKLVTRAKNPTIANRRVLLAGFYNDEKAVKKLVDMIAPRYEKRAGGYTRITKLAPRKGDASNMAVIEFV
ncbi:MAG TPA: 50S ribosomal protein L17 [Candidatus Paceibacterota bacterium]|jgi:large subunit ribosomal protein L17|nr:50S ribosomal protein L17 [Candidatus Paceibacterota bacterium]